MFKEPKKIREIVPQSNDKKQKLISHVKSFSEKFSRYEQKVWKERLDDLVEEITR